MPPAMRIPSTPYTHAIQADEKVSKKPRTVKIRGIIPTPRGLRQKSKQPRGQETPFQSIEMSETSPCPMENAHRYSSRYAPSPESSVCCPESTTPPRAPRRNPRKRTYKKTCCDRAGALHRSNRFTRTKITPWTRYSQAGGYMYLLENHGL